jgi:methyl-accepting chemotaxis protein
MDSLLQRAAEALEEIRSGIDIQATTVAALLDQSKAGLGRAGVDAAEALGTRLEAAGSSLDTLTARLAEQERISQRVIADIGMGVASLDERFAQMAADGDARAGTISSSLNRLRSELESLSQHSGSQEGALEGLAERTAAVRAAIEHLATEIGQAQAGSERMLAVAEAARPEIEWAHQASVEAGTRLEAGAGAIEEQHDRLAALLSAVDTGVGGAEKRLAELAEAVRNADAEAARPTTCWRATGPGPRPPGFPRPCALRSSARSTASSAPPSSRWSTGGFAPGSTR